MQEYTPEKSVLKHVARLQHMTCGHRCAYPRYAGMLCIPMHVL